MYIEQLSRKLGAKSCEKVSYKPTVKHVCCNGGNILEMRTLTMTQHDASTKYALCPHCQRMFYATATRHFGTTALSRNRAMDHARHA